FAYACCGWVKPRQISEWFTQRRGPDMYRGQSTQLPGSLKWADQPVKLPLLINAFTRHSHTPVEDGSHPDEYPNGSRRDAAPICIGGRARSYLEWDGQPIPTFGATV